MKDKFMKMVDKKDMSYSYKPVLLKAIQNKHMTFTEAGMLAHKGKVSELLLTHFSAAMDEPEIFSENAKDIFLNTIIGYDGLVKNLSFGEE